MSETETDESALPVSPVVRFLRPVLGAAITLATLAWAADLYRKVGLLFLAEQFLAAIFGLGLALAFLHYPAKRGTARGPLPWYDAIASAAGSPPASTWRCAIPSSWRTCF